MRSSAMLGNACLVREVFTCGRLPEQGDWDGLRLSSVLCPVAAGGDVLNSVDVVAAEVVSYREMRPARAAYVLADLLGDGQKGRRRTSKRGPDPGSAGACALLSTWCEALLARFFDDLLEGLTEKEHVAWVGAASPEAVGTNHWVPMALFLMGAPGLPLKKLPSNWLRAGTPMSDLIHARGIRNAHWDTLARTWSPVKVWGCRGRRPWRMWWNCWCA